MPIKSYILHSEDNMKNELINQLIKLNDCEIIPAENKEVIVLVTDTPDEESDKELYNQLLSLNGLKHISMVSGFDSK